MTHEREIREIRRLRGLAAQKNAEEVHRRVEQYGDAARALDDAALDALRGVSKGITRKEVAIVDLDNDTRLVFERDAEMISAHYEWREFGQWHPAYVPFSVRRSAWVWADLINLFGD